jgi:hypothetical protein
MSRIVVSETSRKQETNLGGVKVDSTEKAARV